MLDERERLLKLRRIPFERLQLFTLGLKYPQQLLDLNLLRERDSPKLLDVALASKIHPTSRSYAEIERKNFRLDDAGRKRESPDELAAFDEERQLARRELHTLAVVSEQRREATSLEPLLKNAKARAVPHQHFATASPIAQEQEQIATQR